MKFGFTVAIRPVIWLTAFFLMFPLLSWSEQSRDAGNRTTAPRNTALWHDDKFEVRTESPYISQSGAVVLAYTVTNKSGRDIVIYREGEGTSAGIMSGDLEIKLFRRLKTSGAYEEIKPNDHSVNLPRTSLPADVPVRLLVGFAVPKERPSWWSGDQELKPTKAIKQLLRGVDAVVILIPSRRIRIVLPVRP